MTRIRPLGRPARGRAEIAQLGQLPAHHLVHRALLAGAQVAAPPAGSRGADLLERAALAGGHALVLVRAGDALELAPARRELEMRADALELAHRVGEQILVADRGPARGRMDPVGSLDGLHAVGPDRREPADQRLPALRRDRERALVEGPRP